MDEIKEANTLSESQTLMSRRNLLKRVAAVVAARFFAPFIPYTPQSFVDEQGTRVDYPKNIEEERNKIRAEIDKLRSEWGLADVQKHLQDAYVLESLQPNHGWMIEEGEILNNLPEGLKPVGGLAIGIADLSFDGNSSRILKEVKSEGRYNNFYFEMIDTRVCNIPAFAAQQTLEQSLPALIHEIIGHGSDSEGLADKCPYDVLLQLELAKWQLFSQVDKMDGVFLRSENGYIFNEFKLKVGSAVAKYIQANTLSANIQGKNGVGVVLYLAEEVAKEVGLPFNQLNFNLSQCISLGEKLLTRIHQGDLRFTGDLQEDYEKVWVEGEFSNSGTAFARELYADIITSVLASQDITKFNSTVLTAVSKVVSTIKEEVVDLIKLKQEIFQLTVGKKQPTPQIETVVQEDPELEKAYLFFIGDKNVESVKFVPDEKPIDPFSELGEVLMVYSSNMKKILTFYPNLKNSEILGNHTDLSLKIDLPAEQVNALKNITDARFIKKILGKLRRGENLTQMELNDLIAKNARLEQILAIHSKVTSKQ